MIGAVVGDIVGSRFEWNNIKTKKFEFFTKECFPTDDSIMSLAIAKALMESWDDYKNLSENAVFYMQDIGRAYPYCGYGRMFMDWIYSDNPQPYNSFGNGAAMRVSACGFAAKTMEEARMLSRKVTEVSHNHPEGIKGAEAESAAIFLARSGKPMGYIRSFIDDNYYKMNFSLDGIREGYTFNETCQETVPQAIMCFLESDGFEDAIRNAISLGGDSDTLAAITGGIAEAYYGVPQNIRKKAAEYLDYRLKHILYKFEEKYGYKIQK